MEVLQLHPIAIAVDEVFFVEINEVHAEAEGCRQDGSMSEAWCF
jgi:hypothetical protein